MGGRPTRPDPALPAYVLVGGASRRMGRDKALLPWRGTVLAAWIGGVLLEAGCASVHLVARADGPEGVEGLTAPSRGALPVLREAGHAEPHPLYGVAAALEHAAPAPLALVLACDLVGIEPRHVGLLLGHRGPVVAEDPKGRRALLAVLPTAEAPEALRLARSQAPVQPFLRRFPGHRLPARALHNANEEADLRDW